jgi:hypothetical protein
MEEVVANAMQRCVGDIWHDGLQRPMQQNAPALRPGRSEMPCH